jgi:hypothetical protein
MNMHAMPSSEHAHNIDVKFTRNAQWQCQVLEQRNLQSCKTLCTYIVKQIRVMKRPSSTKYSNCTQRKQWIVVNQSHCWCSYKTLIPNNDGNE